MSIESMLASNYHMFTHKKRSNWLLIGGICLICFGLLWEYNNKSNTRTSIETNNSSQENTKSYSDENSHEINKASQQTVQTGSTNKPIKDCIIIDLASNKQNWFIEEINNNLNEKGLITSITTNDNSEVNEYKSAYKNVIKVTYSLKSNPTSIDANAISTQFSYSISIFNPVNSHLIKRISNKIVKVGFSEDENIEKIKNEISTSLTQIL